MNKKNFFRTVAIAAIAVFTMGACQDSTKMDEKPAATPEKAAGQALKIAYVEVDSIMSQYTFCKEYTKILEKRQRAEAESQQAAIQRQDQQLQATAQRLQSELMSQTEKFNEALRDSIQHYLAVYNKDKKYSLILTKQGDNILYADKNYDITAEVVAGLNKAYKPKPLDK